MGLNQTDTFITLKPQEEWEAAADELGDVLLQVVFHAVVGEECGTMNLSEIATAICTKLIKRHTHIFGGDKLETAQQVSDNWDKIKEKERGSRGVRCARGTGRFVLCGRQRGQIDGCLPG